MNNRTLQIIAIIIAITIFVLVVGAGIWSMSEFNQKYSNATKQMCDKYDYRFYGDGEYSYCYKDIEGVRTRYILNKACITGYPNSDDRCYLTVVRL